MHEFENLYARESFSVDLADKVMASRGFSRIDHDDDAPESPQNDTTKTEKAKAVLTKKDLSNISAAVETLTRVRIHRPS